MPYKPMTNIPMYRLLNEAKLGELIKTIALSKGVIDSQRGQPSVTTLSALGITKNQSSRSQKIFENNVKVELIHIAIN